MNYDMEAVSPVQDIGAAVQEPPFIKFRASPTLHSRNMQELLNCVHEFMARIGVPGSVSAKDFADYIDTTSRNRNFSVPGATPGNGTIWLFFLARLLNPKVIAESGVFFGSSLFTLRHAVPLAKIFAFDVNLDKLLPRLERLPGVHYYPHDWGTDNVRAEGPSDFCFFDDHVNNCLRIRQAYDRGFRHVVVDDAPDLGEIHDFRYPAVPTVSMIENDKWSDGDSVEWNWNGRRLRYTFRTADTFGAKEIIEEIYRFPSLKRWTGMEDAFHYYVRLKAPN